LNIYGFVSIILPLVQSAFELQLDLHSVLRFAGFGVLAHVPEAVHCDCKQAVATVNFGKDMQTSFDGSQTGLEPQLPFLYSSSNQHIGLNVFVPPSNISTGTVLLPQTTVSIG
jgi:hypothetical protein